jgi:hypothetical protein
MMGVRGNKTGHGRSFANSVFVISYKQDNTSIDFNSFLHPNKLRLLLLLRKDLTHFIQQKFHSDIFYKSFESKLKIDYLATLQHGFGAGYKYINQVLDEIDLKKNLLINYQKLAILSRIALVRSQEYFEIDYWVENMTSTQFETNNAFFLESNSVFYEIEQFFAVYFSFEKNYRLKFDNKVVSRRIELPYLLIWDIFPEIVENIHKRTKSGQIVQIYWKFSECSEGGNDFWEFTVINNYLALDEYKNAEQFNSRRGLSKCRLQIDSLKGDFIIRNFNKAEFSLKFNNLASYFDEGIIDANDNFFEVNLKIPKYFEDKNLENANLLIRKNK